MRGIPPVCPKLSRSQEFTGTPNLGIPNGVVKHQDNIAHVTEHGKRIATDL